jgi:hypothetical protein
MFWISKNTHFKRALFVVAGSVVYCFSKSDLFQLRRSSLAWYMPPPVRLLEATRELIALLDATLAAFPRRNGADGRRDCMCNALLGPATSKQVLHRPGSREEQDTAT